jgi:hypothetical protein
MTQLARRDRLDDANRRMADHLAEAARHWWAMGQVCAEVDGDELYREAGFADVYAWAEKEHGVKRTTVDKAMGVARHFSAEMAERHGSEKLSSTLDYLQATRKVEQAGEATALEFRVRREGRFHTVPFEQATYREIDEAKALVLRSRGEKGPPPPDDHALARGRALEAVLGPVPRGTTRGSRVEVTRDAAGNHRYTVKALSDAELVAFARAVLAGPPSAV